MRIVFRIGLSAAFIPIVSDDIFVVKFKFQVTNKMRTSLITLFFVATLIGFDCAIEEIPKEGIISCMIKKVFVSVEEAKRGLFSRPVNPYSWMNRGRRSLDDADFGDPVDVLSPMVSCFLLFK